MNLSWHQLERLIKTKVRITCGQPDADGTIICKLDATDVVQAIFDAEGGPQPRILGIDQIERLMWGGFWNLVDHDKNFQDATIANEVICALADRVHDYLAAESSIHD